MSLQTARTNRSCRASCKSPPSAAGFRPPSPDAPDRYCMAGCLYLVATPIGNLADISERIRETLQSVALIASEDTRHTGRLLQHLGVQTKMTSYHDHNERTKWPVLIEALERGDDVAVVSDAGTPGIADPGWHVVQEAIARDIDVISIPGPTAFVSALIVSGLPVHRFAFEGYAARKPSGRRKRLRELSLEERTMIFYETPHRIMSLLKDIQTILGGRRVSVSRELTKQHEETVRGTVSDVLETLEEKKPRGEYAVVVEGYTGKSSDDESAGDEFREKPE